MGKNKNEQYKDEVRVIQAIEAFTDNKALVGLVEERLAHGFELYSALDLENDTRDFNQEALEEIVDLLVYEASRRLQGGKVDSLMPLAITAAELLVERKSTSKACSYCKGSSVHVVLGS